MTLSDIKITPILDSLRLEKISDEIYFSEPYRNYVSNSRLGLINPAQEGSPKAFFAGFKPFYSSSLDIGTAVHSMILQPEAYNIVTTVDKPTGKMGVMADKLFTLCKGKKASTEDVKKIAKEIDYYKGNLSESRIQEVLDKYEDFRNQKLEYLQTCGDDPGVGLYLDPKSREISLACIEALKNNRNIQNLLHPKSSVGDIISINENAILLDVLVETSENHRFKLRLKAKLDNYTIDTLTGEICVNDIKTLGRTVDQMQINIDKYHYNREFAFYAFLLKLVTKKFYNVDPTTVSGNYLVVSTIPKHYTKVVPLTKKMYKEGFNEFKYLLKLVAYHVATNKKYKDFGIWE